MTTQAQSVAIESSQINSAGILQVAGGGTGMSTGYPLATVTNLSANPITGTPSSSNFLRGDGTWNSPTGNSIAWVQFTYISSTLTTNGSFNVSSVTRNSTGNYTIAFTTVSANVNYAVVASGSPQVTNNYYVYGVPFGNVSSPYYTAPTTSGFNCLFYNGFSTTITDPGYGSIVVFD
jgi:hypothetical protein